MRVSTNVRRLNASEEFDVSAGEAKIREVVSVEGFIFNHYGQRFEARLLPLSVQPC
jgi:hypothetical protein